jgi:uncharacterized coiled-coil DUF342 family protein
MRKILNERYDEINNYRQDIIKLQNDLPFYREEIKELIKKFEWKIQTTTLSLEEEKRMIKRIQILEKDLHIDNQIKEIKRKVIKLKTEVETLKIKVDSVYSQILEYSKKSQEYHRKYLELIKKSKSIEDTSKTSMMELLKIEKDLNRNRSQYDELIKKINEVEHKIISEEEKRKLLNINKKRDEIEEIAQNKIKKKKKLSFSEFKVLMEEDVL